jgi:hypothetical protein
MRTPSFEMEDSMLRGTSSYGAIAPSSDPANSSAARKDKEWLFLFDGDFGRLDYRKHVVALFEIHSLHGTSCDD